MKKSFTLIELLIVIFIIMILMLLTLNLGWNYIKNIQFKNDKEDFLSTYNKVYSKTISSNYFGWKKYSEFGMSIYRWKNFIELEAFSGNNKILLWRKVFNMGVMSWNFMTWNFYFKSYELGCRFSDGTSMLTWGDVALKLISTYNNDKYCFNINLDACKLSQIKCF